MLAIYFLGRIDGRSPTANLQGLLKKEAKMNAAEFERVARRCGTEFSARGAEMVQIGKTIGHLGIGGG